MTVSGRPPPIVLLPMEVANQIAAGEVIERPASVLKELAENSLDARSRTIQVDLESGGAELIRVRDDGVGIAKGELGLALSRHATSKLRSIGDLGRLATLGFRGEALPSIASVARFSLQSRASGEREGWRVVLAPNGEPGAPEPVPMPPGTAVEVRDLFYNTPARRKFLRAERTELRHLELVLKQVALGRLDVAIYARHGERRILSAAGASDASSRERRLAQILGRRFAAAARYLEVQASGLSLKGWVVTSAAVSASSDQQYFFLDQRPIRDPVIRHALRVAYEGHLEPGLQPAYVLYLSTESGEVDVNVHPTKHEVRFRQPRLVHDFLVSAVRQNLETQATFGLAGDTALPTGRESGLPQSESAASSAPEDRLGMARSSPEHSAFTLAGGLSRRVVAEPARRYGSQASAPSARPGRVTGWVEDRFAVVTVDERVLIVDVARGLTQLAESELARAASGGAALTSRPLLVPVESVVPESVADALEGVESVYAQLGVVVRRIAPDRLSLRQIPSVLELAEPMAVLVAIVALTGAHGLPTTPAWRERLVADLGALPGPPPRRLGPPPLGEIQTLVDRLHAAGVTQPPVTGWLTARALEGVVDPRSV